MKKKVFYLFFCLSINVGLQFPVLKEADAMFDVEQAPEWKDDTNCYRCRAEFSTIRRKVNSSF